MGDIEMYEEQRADDIDQFVRECDARRRQWDGTVTYDDQVAV
jgi:hypothetical protein